MLKRPTSRRKSSNEEVQLNLVPILDTMVTLISFLLFTTAMLSFVNIESTFPEMSAAGNEQKLKEKPLQLTVSLRENEIEVWSPFEKIPAKKIPNTAPGQPDTKVLHETMLEVKQKFPAENKVVIVPNAGASYDTLISVMDNIRLVEQTDPPMFAKNAATGNDEPLKTLFPEVIFGNLLGDN
jgi:biopolymer transport protein ExbD